MSTDSSTEKRWGARSIASLLIFVIATILTPIALVGHWGHRTVIDSQRYIETVGPLIEQPEVQEALSAAVTDAVVKQVDTTAQVQSLLTNLNVPPALTTALSAPIATGINGLIGNLVTKFIQSDQFARVWITLNVAAQKGLVAILEGGNEGPVRIQGDQLVLDLSTALAAIQQHLVDSGITAAANITIPESDRQIELATVQGLSQIRFIYALTSPVLQWFPLIIAAMFALSIALARRRARTVVALGVVLVAVSGLISLGLSIGDTQFRNQLSGTALGPASQVFWDTLLSYLILGVQALLTLGIVLIAAGWFGGRTALARRLRTPLTTGLDQLGDRVSSIQPLRETVGAHVQWIRWAIYVVMFLILLASDVLSVGAVLWCAALGAGLVTAAQLLANAPAAGASAPDGGADDGAVGASAISMPATGSTTNA